MLALSPFQILPLHVADSIAAYLTSYPKKSSTDTDNICTIQLKLTVLYNVSHLWRMLALKHFYKRLTINVAVDHGLGRLAFDYLPDSFQVDDAYYNFVKHVAIKFPATKRHSPNLPFADLYKTWPKGSMFSSARFLEIIISDMHYSSSRRSSTSANYKSFNWITQSLLSSIPHLRELVVRDTNDRFPHRWQYHILLPVTIDSLWTVFDNVMSVDSRLAKLRAINDSLFQNGMGPTKIEYECGERDRHIGYVLENAAPTLQSLRIVDTYRTCAQYLVRSPSNKPITYPKLQRFEYRSDYSSDAAAMYQLDQSITPFPVLRHLVWSSTYIFKDDVLFRGNSGSLEYLDITLADSLVKVLQAYEIFSSGKYSQLSHISIRGNYFGPDNLELGPNAVVNFVDGMLTSKIQSLSFYFSFTYMRLSHRVFSNPYSASIRLLDMSNIMPTLPELLELIHRLPNMTWLRLETVFAHGLHQNETTIDRPFFDDAYARYYPLSNWFKHLEVLHKLCSGTSILAETTLLLAILCPKFVRLSYLSGAAKGYKLERDIETVVQSGVYDDHKDIIIRFLNNTSSPIVTTPALAPTKTFS